MRVSLKKQFCRESLEQREQEEIIPERRFKGEGLECQTKDSGNVIAPELRKRDNSGIDKGSQTLVIPGVLAKAEN